MKMNKLYMAASAVALGLSSNAMALTFTDGDFTGGVDVGGDITIPVASNQWQWATGDALLLDRDVTTLTNNYKTMTIPATGDLPLLVGQTKAATVGNTGNVGINPQIAFTNAAGATVTPVWDATGNTGKGTITLPVTATDGTTALGSMTLKVKVGALRAALEGTGSASLLQSTNSSGASLLYGATAQPSAAAGTLTTGSTAAAWNAVLGALPATGLRNQLNTSSGLSGTTWTSDTQAKADGFTTPSYYFSGTYGLGIAQGDNIVVTFTNPVTVTTQWKTALKATVTYL